ncbi:hypothetical protein CRYUN_Cryun16bG0082300 [Craigia yunnanensis]
MTSSLCSVISRGPSSSCCYCFYSGPKTKYSELSISNTTSGSPAIGYQAFQAGCFSSSRRSGKFQSLTVKESISDKGKQKRQLEISWAGQSMKTRLLLPKQGTLQKFKCFGGPISWPQGCASAGLVCGSRKSAPSDHVQRELADDLRAKVAEEFIKRRKETEWMPTKVYMYDKDAGSLIAIVEHGQEYGTENPIRVLYHGFGHYDALQMPGRKPGKSKL